MRVKIILFVLLFILLGQKNAHAIDWNYFMWPKCDVIPGGHNETFAVDGANDSNAAGVCGLEQARSCNRTVVGDPIVWLHNQNHALGWVLWFENGLLDGTLGPLLHFALSKANGFPAYVCVPAAAVQPIPTETSTEIGTIKAKPEELITTLVRIFAALAGGVSVFFMLSGAVKYLFSSGNPEAVEEAKGIISHAISGFALVFLAVFLLRFIGIDVLHIPGFTATPGGGVLTP